MENRREKTTSNGWYYKNTGRTHFKRIYPWNKGLSGWITEEHRQRLIDHATGRTPWNKGKAMVQIQGDKNWIWAGDNVSYRALHTWVQRHLESQLIVKMQ